MKDITEKEKLALLGFDDPPHSLAWYKERFENLPHILEQYIVDSLREDGIFPKEAKGLDEMPRCHQFYLLIEVNGNQYIVKVNNMDRKEVQNQYSYDNINEAAKALIDKSFTMGGSIRQYWNTDKK